MQQLSQKEFQKHFEKKTNGFVKEAKDMSYQERKEELNRLEGALNRGMDKTKSNGKHNLLPNRRTRKWLRKKIAILKRLLENRKVKVIDKDQQQKRLEEHLKKLRAIRQLRKNQNGK